MSKGKVSKKMWTPERIKNLRKKCYGELQEQFCLRLGVTVSGLRAWEQGQGEPGGSAQILLDRLEEDFRDGRIHIKQTA